jgi:F0F1-type ATP synthase membrane subunit b/b'
VKQDIQQVKDTVQKIKDEVHDLFGLKSAFKEVKQEVKDAVDGAKQAFKEAKQEVKDAVDGAKQAFKEAKQEVKDAVNDAKQAFKDAKQEAKDAVNDAKQAFKDAKQEAKDAVNEVKQEGKDALKDAGDIFKSGSKHAPASPGFHMPSGSGNGAGNGFHVPGGNGQAGNFHVPGGNGAANAGRGGLHIPAGAGQAGPQIPMHAQAMSGHGLSAHGFGGSALSQGSAGGSGFDLQQAAAQAGDAARTHGQTASAVADALPQNALHGSTVITRAGGFTPDGIVDAVNAAHTPTLLQSPSEGQLLILRTEQAAPLSSQDFTSAFVEGQMDGLSSSDAFASALQSKGYLVYERPWDSWLTAMIKKVVL